MHVLITRPQKEAERLKEQLEQCGIYSIINPLLTIHQKHIELDINDVEAIILTSAQVLENDIFSQIPRELKLYVVGVKTAKRAKGLGFNNLCIGHNSVQSLIPLLEKNYKRIVYLSGADVRLDLKETLHKRGITLEQHVVYKAEAVNSLSMDTWHALETNTLDYVLFFSPRTAHIFVESIKNKTNLLKRLKAICGSEAIKNVLNPLQWSDILVSENPTAKSVKELILRIKKAQGLIHE